MQRTFKRKAQMLLYGSIGYGMERSRKGGGIKQKTDGKIRHGKTYDKQCVANRREKEKNYGK
ncbi:hypothetical protein [Hominisplanchenecus faecis]|uniref:hypothetical protein n=1 Tax=Hominisplanchenecus faecis TaxID=2885351 RepID=UPI0032BFD6B9